MTDHLLYKLCNSSKRPLIMGILNVTPDSFSDGNKFLYLESSIDHAIEMINQGADIIDIGGESTRPGSMSISVSEELSRIIPILKELRKISDIPVSIDTRKAEVANNAIENGANIINDISALRFDKDMSKILKSNKGIGLIMMHMQGQPENMQSNPHYNDIIFDVCNFFRERISNCLINGIDNSRILIDPGIGFGKTTKHNLLLLNNIPTFKTIGIPIVIGASRKSFINDIYHSEPNERIGGSLAVTSHCIMHKIDVIRVHDVREHAQFKAVSTRISGTK